MLSKRLRPALFGIVLCSSSAQAVIINEILGLGIGGTDFDVTFYDSSLSFNDIWDGNGNGIFGDDDSILNRQPVFWGDRPGASLALRSIINDLGLQDTIIDAVGDSARIPFGPSIFPLEVAFFWDAFKDPQFDRHFSFVGLRDRPFGPGFHLASFEVSPAATVPEPTCLALVLLGLTGIGWRRVC